MKFKNITYMHEHVKIDLSKEKNDIDCKLDLFEETKKEFLMLIEKGVKRIVDVTNVGMGRDIDYINRIEKETGIEIICSTGYYKEPFLPIEVDQKSIYELADKMIFEIETGIDGTNIKADIIGEIGTGFQKISHLEEKVFRAAAIAGKKTGKYISTHTSLGRLGKEQLDILESEGMKLEKVILGHTDLSGDLEYIKELLRRGAYIAFDTIGKEKYLPEAKRIEFIKTLCNEGWVQKILLSVDLTRRSHLKVNGGIGYSYLLDKFVPMLIESGLKEIFIEQILENNPLKIFSERR